jgi:hypothetical protein
MINHQLTLALKLAGRDQRASIENDGQHSLSPPVRNSHHIRKGLFAVEQKSPREAT